MPENELGHSTAARLAKICYERALALFADAGLRIEQGLRRTTRACVRPLEFWRNETVVYERSHDSKCRDLSHWSLVHSRLGLAFRFSRADFMSSEQTFISSAQEHDRRQYMQLGFCLLLLYFGEGILYKTLWVCS